MRKLGAFTTGVAVLALGLAPAPVGPCGGAGGEAVAVESSVARPETGRQEGRPGRGRPGEAERQKADLSRIQSVLRREAVCDRIKMLASQTGDLEALRVGRRALGTCLRAVYGKKMGRPVSGQEELVGEGFAVGGDLLPRAPISWQTGTLIWLT